MSDLQGINLFGGSCGLGAQLSHLGAASLGGLELDFFFTNVFLSHSFIPIRFAAELTRLTVAMVDRHPSFGSLG